MVRPDFIRRTLEDCEFGELKSPDNGVVRPILGAKAFAMDGIAMGAGCCTDDAVVLPSPSAGEWRFLACPIPPPSEWKAIQIIYDRKDGTQVNEIVPLRNGIPILDGKDSDDRKDQL